MSTSFVEADHPRARSGEFVDKANSAPVDTLAAVSIANPLARRFDTVEEKVEAMRAELEAGVDALAEDENWQRHLQVMSKFHRYSFNNQMLIGIQCPEATRVAGFKVWKSLGRNVMKGQKAIAILAPKVVTKKDPDGLIETDEAGRPIKRVVGFTSASVFDVSQTEGEDLPKVYEELSEEPPEGFIADLEAAIAATGYTVEYRKTGDSSLGFTSPSSKTVVVDPDLSPGTRATTLAHELGHIRCGHLERLDEYHTGHAGHRGAMEVEAESFSYVLSRMNGMATNLKPASEYVAGWSTREPEALRESGETLQKAIKATVGESGWSNVVE